ncbi:MAG: septum site-determining protein MinC, partial [Desulfobacteraceae bacterium]
MIEKTPSVRIKGVGDSIWVTVIADTPLESIQAELDRLFDPLKHLASTTRVVIDTGQHQKSARRYRQISRYLKEAFNLNEITTPRGKNSDEKNRFRMQNSHNRISQHHRDTLVIAGRVRSGQSVSSKKHLIIMGDVNPGCELTAGGDILVIGSLR